MRLAVRAMPHSRKFCSAICLCYNPHVKLRWFLIDDRRRGLTAAMLSLTLHALAMFGLLLYAAAVPLGFWGPDPERPVRVRLQRPPERVEKNLIDVTRPAERPVGETDLIAVQDSNAASPDPAQGEHLGPATQRMAAYDQLGAAASIPAPPPQNSAPTPVPERTIASDRPKDTPPPATPPAPPQETVVVAQADAPPEPPGLVSRETVARERGGVRTRGIGAFEAMRDQLAPYLKDVRDRVEREWRAMLQLRFKGVGRVEAVLNCAIAPDGRLIAVSVVEPGASPTYAPLCKDAIERAGPFPAFPFSVPETYRDKFLEIQWTFTVE